MDVAAYQSQDVYRLGELARKERNAKQRDRYRTVLLALEGLTEPEIRTGTARSRGFIQRWVYAYRDGGIEAIAAKKPPGQPPKLAPEAHPRLKELLDEPGAPRRGRDVQQLLADRFGVTYSIRGALLLLHRLGYEPLRPRPVNPKKDPAAEAQWGREAPLLSSGFGTSTPTSRSNSGSRTKADSGRKDA